MRRLPLPRGVFSNVAKLLPKLLPPPGVCARRYYRSVGDTAPHFLLLPRCITELARVMTYENLSRTDVVLTSPEMKWNVL